MVMEKQQQATSTLSNVPLTVKATLSNVLSSVIDKEILDYNDTKEEWNKLNHHNKIYMAYKETKGVEPKDKGWDSRNYAKTIPFAIQLQELFKDHNTAIDCIEDLGKKFDAKDYSWTLRAIVNNAEDWILEQKKKRRQTNG